MKPEFNFLFVKRIDFANFENNKLKSFKMRLSNGKQSPTLGDAATNLQLILSDAMNRVKTILIFTNTENICSI